ncbi:hypothetical protein Scep_024900 [Stephania cephalantha]|uniref:Uncharacterized protein n=1 Tax=Stephania cephalantha TaxID=152367 RepID=A0AAP0EXE9_9MAGN
MLKESQVAQSNHSNGAPKPKKNASSSTPASLVHHPTEEPRRVHQQDEDYHCFP